jgi:hypothetical protein
MGVFALNPEKVYSSGNYSGRALHYLLPKIAFLRHARSSKNLEMVHFEGICKNTQYRGIYRNGLPIRADLHWPDGRRRGGGSVLWTDQARQGRQEEGAASEGAGFLESRN